jgi:hypothetical protein
MTRAKVSNTEGPYNDLVEQFGRQSPTIACKKFLTRFPRKPAEWRSGFGGVSRAPIVQRQIMRKVLAPLTPRQRHRIAPPQVSFGRPSEDSLNDR